MDFIRLFDCIASNVWQRVSGLCPESRPHGVHKREGKKGLKAGETPNI